MRRLRRRANPSRHLLHLLHIRSSEAWRCALIPAAAPRRSLPPFRSSSTIPQDLGSSTARATAKEGYVLSPEDRVIYDQIVAREMMNIEQITARERMNIEQILARKDRDWWFQPTSQIVLNFFLFNVGLLVASLSDKE